jgi:hypothetical protein
VPIELMTLHGLEPVGQWATSLLVMKLTTLMVTPITTNEATYALFLAK